MIFDLCLINYLTNKRCFLSLHEKTQLAFVSHQNLHTGKTSNHFLDNRND